jgi:hypothetical protein
VVVPIDQLERQPVGAAIGADDEEEVEVEEE